jgi:hypothetical protein
MVVFAAVTVRLFIRTLQATRVVIAGHAFVQNLRRGHYEIAAAVPRMERMAAAFAELALAV